MKQPVSLQSVPKGSRVFIVDMPEGRSRTQLVRLGVVKGDFIRCLERLPGGTVVIEKNRREIALGATLTKGILVSFASTDTLKERS